MAHRKIGWEYGFKGIGTEAEKQEENYWRIMP
jgi:hypothetical protein